MSNSRPTHWFTLGPAALLIVAAATRADDARHPDAVEIYHCAFGEEWDVNYDRWPDRWVRKSGSDYPHYVNIEIDDNETAAGKESLVIDLDGAAASITSPPIRVLSRFGYVFEAQLKNEGLAHSTVVLTLDFCDKLGRVLQTRKSKPLGNTKGWQQVRLDEIELNNPEIDRVIVGLHTIRSTKGDLKGRVSLADVWLARLPRITVSTNSPCNVYPLLDDVVVRCELSGIRERDPEIRFELLDAAGAVNDAGSFQLNGQLIAEDAKPTTKMVDRDGESPAGYEGSAEWHPKVPGYGFYRVVVNMVSSESANQSKGSIELGSRTVWLAIVPPLDMPKQGEFGWTLPHGNRPLAYQEMSNLLAQAGVNWVKVPAWFDANDRQQGDELIRFVELLGASHIDVVGVIDRPPAGTELANRLGAAAAIADVLSPDASTWSPILEPVMTRLSLRVRWWQLGRDGDTSFAGAPGLNKRIDELRTQLFRFGQDVQLGISSDWAGAGENRGQVAWNFEQMSAETPPTEAEFKTLLARKHNDSAQRWVTIDPPPRTSDPNDAAALDARSSAFVRQLVAAKEHGVDAIIISNPFNDDNGLMHANGEPAELLLPWRTTAAMLGGAQYLGQLQLPAGSENRVFLRPDGQVVMVVWNDKLTQESVYLGSDIRHIDIWGNSTATAVAGDEQVINVGPRPAFVLGLHEAITRWRMAVRFHHKQVPSVFGKPQANSLHLENFFPQGVGGSLRIIVPNEANGEQLASARPTPVRSGFVPDRWSIEPPTMSFQLAPGEQLDFPFNISLKDALYGKQPVRIEFTIEADEPYQFSVYRGMEVGTEDLTLTVKSHLDKNGTLIVEQFATNHAEHLADFRCYLYAKKHRPQQTQVYRLGEQPDRKVYRFPNGRDLVDKEMLLELEERNGSRLIKYRFVATETPAGDDADPIKPTQLEVERLDSKRPRDGTLGWGVPKTPEAG